MAPPVAHQPAHSRPRDHSVDIVRGLAITLVVFGHTLQGLGHRGWWDTPASNVLDHFIYSFHMPAFFFVSGLFVGGTLARLTPAQFLADKARTILYPYLLWAAIVLVQEPLIARFKYHSIVGSPISYLKQLVAGDQSWFLQCLFLCMVMTLLTSRLPDWLRALLATVACIAIPVTGIAVVDQLAREWAFVAIGQLVGRRIVALTHLRLTTPALLLILLGAGQMAAVVYLQPAVEHDFLRNHTLFLLLGLSGTLALFCVARLMAQTPLANLAALTGEASIAVYLLHPYFQGATREAIVVILHTHRPLPHLVLTTICATVVPAWIWHERVRLRITWLFRWGEQRTGAAISREAASPSLQPPLMPEAAPSLYIAGSPQLMQQGAAIEDSSHTMADRPHV